MNVTTILNWVVDHHTTLLNLLLGAAGLSVGLEVLLTKLKVQSKKIAFTLLHVFSALTALASFGLGVSGKEATGIYASLALVSQWWHRFVISDANEKYVTPFLSFLSNQNTPPAAPAAPQATVSAGTLGGSTNTTASTTSVPTPSTVSTPMVGATAGDAKPFTLDPTAGK